MPVGCMGSQYGFAKGFSLEGEAVKNRLFGTDF